MSTWGFIVRVYVFLNIFEMFYNKKQTSKKSNGPLPKGVKSKLNLLFKNLLLAQNYSILFFW